MPIAALPKATVQLLGSSQVLTTPTSLIKELIDNALDAKATSIDILISKNTLDKLEVRDNGHGISSEDFDFLGKRGHTSKLRTFEELKFIGGISLGFRGEALASAVQLGVVSIITKTEGESVATRLVLKAPGVVDQKTRTSHPVGTTVCVQNFMDEIPVRKKNFEKESSKTLAKINQLLRSYALARPSIRFSLKVTGGGKNSWSFVPRPHDGIIEAISLVIGRDAAMACTEKSLLTTQHRPVGVLPRTRDEDSTFDEDSQAEDGSFAIEAVLPKPDSDLFRTGAGQYFSIDSRPVSHEKGTMKKIVTLFKKYIRDSLCDSTEKVKNPFIRLSIKCPVASYDANVEPSKDDVLFSNEAVVLGLAEKLFKEVYGELKAVSVISASLEKEPDDLDLLLAREPEATEQLPKGATRKSTTMLEPSLCLPEYFTLPQSSPNPSSVFRASSPMTNDSPGSSATAMEDISDEQIGSGSRKWGFTMSKDFTEEVDDGRQHGRSQSHFRSPQQHTPYREDSGAPLNPWVIAKMTAPISHKLDTSEPRSLVYQPLSDIRMPSVSPASSNELAPPVNFPRQTLHSDDVRAIQSSVSRRYSASSVHPQLEEEGFIGDQVLPTTTRLPNEFVSARSFTEDALVSPTRTAPKKYVRSRGPSNVFVSPLTTSDTQVAQLDGFVQATLFGKNPRRRRQSSGCQVMLQNELNQDLDWAMDFELRKQDATRRRREGVRAAEMAAAFLSSSGPTRSSPHKNRYNAAIASLNFTQPEPDTSEATLQSQVPFMTTLPDKDPRAYLMRRQKNAQGDRPMSMRTKSTRLPLERIPQEALVHDLVFNMTIDTKKLQTALKALVVDDVFVRRGGVSAGLEIEEADRPMLDRKLQEIINIWNGSGREQRYEVEYICSKLLGS